MHSHQHLGWPTFTRARAQLRGDCRTEVRGQGALYDQEDGSDGVMKRWHDNDL